MMSADAVFSHHPRAADLPSASVVIAAYTFDRWDDIVAGLSAIGAQTVPPLETILVIDHNANLLDQARATLPTILANLRILESTRSRGASGTRNVGVAAARGDVVVFLDDDARPEPAWLEELLVPFEDPAVTGTGGRLVPGWPAGRPAWFPAEFDWVVGASYVGLPEGPADIRNPIAASAAFRRAAILDVGGFQEDYGRVGRKPVGCEETELAIQIQRADPGSRFRYAPMSVAYHKVPPWRIRPAYFVRRCYYEGTSKALLTRFVGVTRALDAEASYLRSTLPKAMVAGLRDGLKGDLWGLARTGAVVIGVAATAAGFIAGQVALRWTPPVSRTSIGPLPSTIE